MQQGQLSVSFIEVVVLQVNYAVTDFLQINLLSLPTEIRFDDRHNDLNLVLGVKAQILKSNGLFQGLSISADYANVGNKYTSCWDECYEHYEGPVDNLFNLYGRQSPDIMLANVAASLGGDRLKGHFSIGQILYSTDALETQYYGQAGIEYRLIQRFQKDAMKLMLEATSVNSPTGFASPAYLFGFRYIARKTVIDFSWPLVIFKNQLVTAPYPFGSLNFFF